MLDASKDIKTRIEKLFTIASEIRKGESFIITRLTIVKKLIVDLQDAKAFSRHIANMTRDEYKEKTKNQDKDKDHLKLMNRAVKALECAFKSNAESNLKKLKEVRSSFVAEQNQFNKIPFGHARVILSPDLLLIEEAIDCFLASDIENAKYWVYQITKTCCSEYDGSGSDLNKKSLKSLNQIASFWASHYEVGKKMEKKDLKI